MQILKFLDDFMYYPILIVVLAAAAIYFSVRTRFIQIRLFPEALRVLLEKPDDKQSVSSFQALMVLQPLVLAQEILLAFPVLLSWEDLALYFGCGCLPS